MSEATFRILAAAALVDGSLGEAEKPVILKAAREMGLTTERAQELLKETAKGGKLKADIPADAGERATLFRSLVDLVAADGVIDPGEMALFQRLGPKFGLNELELEDLLRAAAEGKK